MKRSETAPVQWFQLATVTAVMILAGSALARPGGHLAARPAGKKDSRVCAKVAQDTQRSCRSGAQDEYWLALARCENGPQASEGTGADPCEKDARAELKMELGDCADQLQARNDICDLLGGGSYSPSIDPGHFVSAIDNAYLTLTPGTTFHYQNQTAEGLEVVEVEVTHETRTILGVVCVVVHDFSKVNDQITEDTLDWFAQDADGNVWYFGEESKQYSDGVLVAIDGSWMAGVDGALPGIVMEANPQVGDVYRQEFAIGEAEDMAQVVALGQSGNVPYTGPFTNALQTKEFSGLEPDAVENKYYVPGVGLVLTVDLETGDREELVSITTN